MDVQRRHIVISGTGRAGTTFLVQLLGECGLETGQERLRYYGSARAGLEAKITDPSAPYVVKSPQLAEQLDQVLEDGAGAIAVDHLIVPVRDLEDAAASRLRQFEADGLRAKGGLWQSAPPSRQQARLAQAFHRLLLTAAAREIPVALLEFPSFVNDPAAAWGPLRPVLAHVVDEQSFRDAHQRVARTDAVHARRRYSSRTLLLLDVRWGILRVAKSLRWRFRVLTRRPRRVIRPVVQGRRKVLRRLAGTKETL